MIQATTTATATTATTATSRTNVIVTQRAANELAMSITGKPYISWSQVLCVRRCGPKLAMGSRQRQDRPPPRHWPSPRCRFLVVARRYTRAYRSAAARGSAVIACAGGRFR